MSIDYVMPYGFWRICDIIDNHLVTRSYYCYSRKEAVSKFRAEFNL